MSVDMRKRRLPTVLLIAALSMCTLVAGGGALATGAGAAKKKPPSQAQVAVKLAKQVLAAPTPAARHTSLVTVMKALHVGVYTAAGKPVVRGAERNARDFYLYDFELRIVADALRAKRTDDLDTLASSLFGLGVGRSGAALPSAEIEQVLVRSVRAARARPRRKAALPALLIRELGLRQSRRYDLAAAPAPDTVRLDALQELLVLADAANGRRAPAARRMAAVAADCSRITGDRKTDEILGQIRWPGTPAELDRLHDDIVSKGIVLQDLTPGSHETHYFPAGHASDGGKQLRFEVRAVMTVDVPQAVRCGPLAGRKLPAKGPVEGVPITWADSGLKTSRGAVVPLEQLGTVYADAKTDANGIATIFFSPNTEKYPGFGSEEIAAGDLAMAVTAGQSFQSWPIRVVRHRPQGFKFSGLKFRVEFCCDGSPGFAVGTYEVVQARRCGDDPSEQWTLLVREIVDWPPPPRRDHVIGATWLPGHEIVIGGSGVVRATTGLVVVFDDLDPHRLEARAIQDNPFDVWQILVGRASITEESRTDKGAFEWSCAEAGF